MMIVERELCLVCHDSNSKDHEIQNIYEAGHKLFKGSLEKILKRRIYAEKLVENHVCVQCYKLVKDFEYLEEKLANITEDLKTKFELLHPTKRGRKKREQVPQPQKESVATAHSGQY